ncbi:MAG: thiamine phosphate synthase [Thiobacillaceae bacterium]|jgi:thiamine-phosphate pyrophosphorylase|nr:thiamine phosphate synthase [Thiobacillaceae bacterium]
MNQAEAGRLAGLYAVTPDWPDTARLLAVTEAILAGGCRLLQYRHKTATDGLRLEQALALRALTRRHGTRLIVNDDVELALRVAAEGAHLGGEDGDLAAARQRLGPERLLGASCYQSLATARQARAAGADYVAFGSFFPSPTKPRAGRAELALLAEARRTIDAPLAAIGGINLDNAAPLVSAGADLLAVISALYDAPDPRAAAEGFNRMILKGTMA